MRWLAERGRGQGPQRKAKSVRVPCTPAGLIAGGGIFGLLGIVIALLQDQEFRYHIFRPGLFQIGPKIEGALAGSTACGGHVPASRRIAVLLRAQKAGVAEYVCARLLTGLFFFAERRSQRLRAGLRCCVAYGGLGVGHVHHTRTGSRRCIAT